VDEICTTLITISLDTYSHPACGNVSHNVTISGTVIYPDTVDGSTYTINNLESDTTYNIVVTSTYNSGSRILNRFIKTPLPQCEFYKTISYSSYRIASRWVATYVCDFI